MTQFTGNSLFGQTSDVAEGEATGTVALPLEFGLIIGFQVKLLNSVLLESNLGEKIQFLVGARHEKTC